MVYKNGIYQNIEEWFQGEYIDDGICNTPKCSLLHAGGYMEDKTLKFETNGATTENLFTIAGTVRILGICGIVTAIGAGGVGVDDTLNNLKLELNDGAASADITLANSDLTGNGTVGTVILKDATAAVKMTIIEADTVKYHEAATNKLFQEGLIVAKNGTTSYIRASYTGDAATDITICWTIRYAPKTAASVITAV